MISMFTVCCSPSATTQDGGTQCGPGTAIWCDSSCVDVQHDARNCGSCGNACAEGERCVQGTCALTCGSGLSRCGTLCVDLRANANNCNACNHACPSGEVCNQGACAPTCQSDLTNCGGGCVDLATDDFDCGACGKTCNGGERCVAGQCEATCQLDWSACAEADGGTTCVDSQHDRSNCGACGNACASEYACVDGACVVECFGGTSLCGGQCVDEAIDSNHCGACNTVCGGGELCTRAHCCATNTPYFCGQCDTLSNCIVRDANRITAGYSHTCAITSSGAAKCWGHNAYGELGSGSTTSSFATAQSVTGLSSGVTAISGFEHGTCALASDGAAYCWGDNSLGQLGDGSTTSSNTPVSVSGITTGGSITSGGNYANCFLLQSGAVTCTGSDFGGQLGLGSITSQDYTTPQTSTITGVIAIGGTGAAATTTPMCAVLTNGTVECWGYSGATLGDGKTTMSGSPITVNDISDAVQVTGAWDGNICVVTRNGALKCWGTDKYGQLGDGTTTDSTTPVTASLTNVSAVSIGGNHMCAVTTAGAVECVGDNPDGELGNGTTNPSTTWQTAIVSGAVGVACGAWHTCALMANGSVYCWGYNGDGELGDGLYLMSTSPVLVQGF